mgnify:CR=1 FL=1
MKTRLYVAAVLGGLALLIAVALVVFAFGRHNPSPPSLQDNPRPEIPGQILYLDQDFMSGSAVIGVHPNENTATVWLNTDDLVKLIQRHGNQVHIVEI